MIDGMKLTDLKIIEDERGNIRRMLRADDPHFQAFGEIYFSEIRKGVVKAWHMHKKMTLNYACVVGEVEIALVDFRAMGPLRYEVQWYSLRSSGRQYRLLTIPPGVWNGFRIPVGSQFESAIVANCATLPHSADEIVRVHPRDFLVHFDWGPYETAG